MSKKKKTTVEPSKQYAPFITGGANDLKSAYQAYAPQAAANAASIQSLVPGLLDKAKNGNPALNSAVGYNNDVLGGKYLSGNPQLEGMVDLARSNTTDAVGARFGALGGYGGTKYAQSLGKGLSDSELALRYENYGDERDRMDAAVGQAPGLVNAGTVDLQALLTAISQAGETAMAPTQGYASGLAGLLGGYTTTTSKDSALKALADRMQAAAQSAAAASDRRLKTAIEKLGEFADGLGIYAWNYIWGGPRFVGVMADEVERLRPDMLGPVIEGYQTVKYFPAEID